MTLKEWLERYYSERKADLKPSSLEKIRQTRDKLLAYFDPQIPLRAITVDQAAGWRQWLMRQRISEATVKVHCGNAKTIMREAVRRKMIPEDPFRYLKSGATPTKYDRYITREEIERVIEACPDAEWRLLFGLARYAGLRVPSKSRRLRRTVAGWRRC